MWKILIILSCIVCNNVSCELVQNAVRFDWKVFFFKVLKPSLFKTKCLKRKFFNKRNTDRNNEINGKRRFIGLKVTVAVMHVTHDGNNKFWWLHMAHVWPRLVMHATSTDSTDYLSSVGIVIFVAETAVGRKSRFTCEVIIYLFAYVLLCFTPFRYFFSR